MKVSGQVEVRWLAGVIEVRQSNREPVGLIGAHTATITSLAKALQTAVGEVADHCEVYRIPVRVAICSSRTWSATGSVEMW